MAPLYQNRRDAGRALARALRDADALQGKVGLVLALPRGGVPVAFEVAEALRLPLDLMLVRKLGVPGHEELAMGAIAGGGVRVLHHEVIDRLAIANDVVEQAAVTQQAELERRDQAYRGGRPAPAIQGRCVILVDDGLATGSTMAAAVGAVRQQQPGRLVVAVPVAPPDTCAAFEAKVDQVICPAMPESFGGVGAWYHDFTQTTDDQVRDLLNAVWTKSTPP